MSGGYELVSFSSEYGKHLASIVINNINQYDLNKICFVKIFQFIFSFENYLYLINLTLSYIESVKPYLSTKFYFCNPNFTNFETFLNEIRNNLNSVCDNAKNIINCINYIYFQISLIRDINFLKCSYNYINKYVEFIICCIINKLSYIKSFLYDHKTINTLLDLKNDFYRILNNLDFLRCGYGTNCGNCCVYFYIIEDFRPVKSLIILILNNIVNIVLDYDKIFAEINLHKSIIRYQIIFIITILYYYKTIKISIKNNLLNLFDNFYVINSHIELIGNLYFETMLFEYSSFINDFLNTNDIPDRCSCVKFFESNNNISEYYIKGYSNYLNNIDTSILSKLNKQTRENHICLCLVIKYVLFPSIMTSLYFVFGTKLEIHGTMKRRFDNYNNFMDLKDDVSKMLLFVFHIVSVIINIILKDSYVQWKSGHPGGVEVKCFCMSEKYEKHYLISIILFVSSLVENIWTMDKEMFQVFVNHLSSLMWEFDITNNSNNVHSLLPLPSLNLSINLTHYIKTISLTVKKSNGTCNGNGDSQIVLHTEIAKSEAILVKSVKLFFKTVVSSLTILIKTPLFSLVYSSLSGLAFYVIQNGEKIGLSSKNVRTVIKSISVTYLECSKNQECTCSNKNECKICLVGKINYLSLIIMMKIIRYSLGSAVKHLMVDSLKLTTNAKIHFVRNGLVNRNIEILRMSKLNLLTSTTNVSSNNVESVRNWGYDTQYEHQSTNNPQTFSDHYPDLYSDSYVNGNPYMSILLD